MFVERRSVIKSQKAKKACVERKVGECFQWAHGQCSKGDSCSFSHDIQAYGNSGKSQTRKGRSSSLASHSKVKQTDGEGQKSSQGSGSKQENSFDKSELPCRFKFCKNPSCKFWHPPVCLNYWSEKGCVHGDKCHCRHVEAEGKPNKKSKGTRHRIKIREGKGPSRGIIQKCAPHERSPCAPKFHMRRPCTGRMRPQSSMGFGEKHLQAQEFRQNYVICSWWSESNAGAHFKETRGARTRSWFKSLNAHDEQKKLNLRGIRHFAEVQETLLWYILPMEKCIQTWKHKCSVFMTWISS